MKNLDPSARPPKIARHFLHLLLRRKRQEDLAPELDELFQFRARRSGPVKAGVWYWRQVFGFWLRWRSLRAPQGPGGELVTGGGFRLGRPSGLDSLTQDGRFAFRTLRRRPLFTLVAIGTLGLGIGATTTIFGMVDATLLRGLPYPEADRLLSIWTSRLNSRDEWVTESLYPPEFRELQENASTLESVALYFFAGGSLQGQGDPMNLIVGEGTAALPEVAGIQPQLGRWFRPEEVGPERTRVAVLGDGLWKERFGADPNVIGTTVLLEHHPYTVIGVMPPEFRLKLDLFQETQRLFSPQDTGERPVWVPSGHNYGSDWYYATEGYSFEALARLRPGVSLEAAAAEVEALVRGDRSPDQIQVHIGRRDQLELAGIPAQLLLLVVPSVLLLLIACGNVATLLLGESVGRQAEVATRSAIGASTRRIARQLLTESVLLGLAGSGLGFLLAFGATRILVAFAPATSAMESVRINLPALVFCSAAGVLAGMVFGLAPASMLARRRGSGLQPHGARLSGAGRKRVNLVTGFEVALTVILLVCGTLFTRTLLNLTAVEMGFESENLVAFRGAIDDGLPAAERAVAYGEMISRMEAVPGVESATGSWSMPLLMSLWTDLIATREDQLADGSLLPRISYDMVMPNYHETLGIPLLAGRNFTFADGPDAPPVVIVSETTAADLWPDRSAVGQRLKFGRKDEWATVVGVVRDVRYGGPDSEPRSPLYRPFLQDPGHNGIRLVLTARTRIDPAELASQLEDAARSAYPSVLLREGEFLSTAISNASTDQRYRALLVMAFGLAAVALAAVGIFGVVGRAVAQRAHELAIRMALGAESGRLGRLVLGSTLLTGAVGAGTGLVVAWWGSRFFGSFLFGVERSDPFTYFLVTLTVLVVCAGAGVLPARRLLRLEPARVLKGE